MTKVNREVEERIKESFKKGYIKGALDKEWGQTTADEEIEKVKAQTRNDLLRELLEEMPKEKIMGGNQYDKVGRHLSCGQSYEICQCKGFNQAIDQVNTLLERKLSTVKKYG